MKVQTLLPPEFIPSGVIKDREQAWRDGDWIGTFNLWIIQTKPTPAIVYQQRSPKMSWAPGKLDVAAGGHYESLETIQNGLREVEEELGKHYHFKDLIFTGRRLSVLKGIDSTIRNTVCDIFIIEDNTPLESYILQEEEVYALCRCPLEELIKVHCEDNYAFNVEGLTATGETIKVLVTKDKFPFNFDNYHLKMALVIQSYLQGERKLVY